MENPVDQQERRTVGQHLADGVDVVERRFAAIVGVAGFLAGLADGALELLHELRIGEVAGAGSPHTALDAHAEEREIAQEVEQLVPCELVVAAQLQVIEVAGLDFDARLVENLLEVLLLLLGHGILDHDDGVVHVAALDEVGLDEGFQLVEEDERAARRDFRCVVVAGLEGGILVADDLGIVIDVQRNGKLVVGVEDDGHALFGDGVDHLLGDVVIGALGLLLDDARADDGFGVLAGRTVHDGGFGTVDVDQCIVHAERPERRHDVFDGADAVAAGLDGGAARSVGHVIAQSGNYGLSLEVDATESDTRIGVGRADGHGYFDARVQPFARKANGRLERLLFG